MLIAAVVLQGLLALSLVAVAAVRARAVLFRHAVDAAPYRRALGDAVEGGDEPEARRLVAGLPDAWLASVGRVALEARAAGEPVDDALTERLGEVREEATRGLVWLRAGARLGPMGGLLTVAVAFVTHPIGERPEVLGEALTALVAGVVTGFVAADAFRVLVDAAVVQVREAHRLADRLDRALAPGAAPAADAGPGPG